MGRRSAYYSRAGSYSRSYNAEQAEQEGRLPRTVAARGMGLSQAAFDAGCEAAGYVPTEWHHVGKYATPVDYYDTVRLGADSRFWAAAAATYKSARKREAVLAAGEEWLAGEQEAGDADHPDLHAILDQLEVAAVCAGGVVR